MPALEVISTARIPIKLWTQTATMEPDAIKQLINVANLPISVKWVAAMPDVHVGYGATVGTVMVTKDAVVPSAIGVDIGCGMMATKTDLDPERVKGKIDDIVHSILRSIPTGFESNRDLTQSVKDWRGKDEDWHKVSLFYALNSTDYVPLHEKAVHQIGSLGGGNHFIEICLDEDNLVWVMLHSGSRHIGSRIATHHIQVAKALMQRYHIGLPDPYLAYLPQGESEFDALFIIRKPSKS